MKIMTLPLLVAIYTKSHQLPFNSCWNVSVILITSPTVILNSPINLFCPLDIAQVLISDDFHSIFPPFPPHFPPPCLASTLVGIFQYCHMAPSLPCVHIRLVSFD